MLVFILFIFSRSVYLFNTYNRARSKQTQPIIVFVPGLGLQGNDYHYLIDHLTADHYQVLIYTSKDTTVKNYQTTVKKWTKDIDILIGNKRVIVIGHSVGGSVAAHFCSNDKRCIGGIDLDGSAAFDEKLSAPFLYIQADTGSYCDTPCFQGRALMEKITTQSKTLFVHIGGIKHFNFTDLRTTSLKNQDYLGPIDGRDIVFANIKVFLNELPSKHFR